jgi:hypothetical protein
MGMFGSFERQTDQYRWVQKRYLTKELIGNQETPLKMPKEVMGTQKKLPKETPKRCDGYLREGSR